MHYPPLNATFLSNLSYQVGSFCSRKRLPCVSVGMTLAQLNCVTLAGGRTPQIRNEFFMLIPERGCAAFVTAASLTPLTQSCLLLLRLLPTEEM